MRNRLVSLTCWLVAIIITITASVVTTYFGWFSVFVLFSIVWTVLDCRRARLWRYYSGISGGPVTILALLLLLGWPIVLPWYLGMRLKILAGVARLREEYQPWRMSDATMSPSGLVQPWRGRKL